MVSGQSFEPTTNRLTTTTGFLYDVTGNQTKAQAADGTWVKLEYDYANRLSAIRRESDNEYLESFHYSPSGNRIMATDHITNLKTFRADVGGTNISEYVEYNWLQLTWTKSYVYLGGSRLSTISNNNGTEYIEFNHPDRLGTRTVTNQQFATSSEQTTLPFGTALNAESTLTNNRNRFTSYDRSEKTGLDYAVNRTYDSKQGRFTQVDPIGINASNLESPQTLNLSIRRCKPNAEKEVKFAGKMKAGIVKFGTGTEAPVEVKLRDKTKLKGYVSEVGTDSFTVLMKKSGAATEAANPNVKQVKGNNLSKGVGVAIAAEFWL